MAGKVCSFGASDTQDFLSCTYSVPIRKMDFLFLLILLWLEKKIIGIFLSGGSEL